MQIDLGDPVVVSMAPEGLRDWGPWQFPQKRRYRPRPSRGLGKRPSQSIIPSSVSSGTPAWS